MFYRDGSGAGDSRWVEEATTASTSIPEEWFGYRELEWESILHKEVDQDSDATVEMVDEDSDAPVVMEDDAELKTNSVGEETEMKSNVLDDELRICNTVHTEDEILI